MREYIPNYTKEYCEEQLKWFEERMDKLPKEFQINESSYSPDLRYTISGFIKTLRHNKPSVTFSGYLETLLRIKEKLQAQGID